MDLSYNLFKKVGLQRRLLHVGDRRVVEEYIRKSLGRLLRGEAIEMMRALDKVGKKTEEELVEGVRGKGSRTGGDAELLKFGRTRGSPDQVCAQARERPGSESAATGLVELRDALEVRGESRTSSTT